jgi:acyl carrier protein
VLLGEHWDTITATRRGADRVVARLELPAQFRAETDEYVLHPSLLDCATALALDLPQAIANGKGFLPLSYGRVVVHDRMPASVTSVIRYKSDPASQLQSFDIAIVDPAGRVVVDITDFSVRLVEPGGMHRSLADRGTARSGGGPDPRRSIDDIMGRSSTKPRGLTTEAGLKAMRQILADRPGPQVVVLEEDLADKLTRVANMTGDLLAEAALVDLGSAGAGADRAGRPGTGAADGTPAEVAPVTEVLLSLWQDTLGVTGIDTDEDFFELGGNSLVAVQLGARIRGYFDIELPIVTLFEHPTVALLAKVVDRELEQKVAALSEAEVAELLTRT